MKKLVYAFFACLFVSVAALAQTELPVNPPQTNPKITYLFTLVPMLLHSTGNWTALYFQSIDRFDNRDDCEKRMHRSAAKFKNDMMKWAERRMPLKSITFFGNCHVVGHPQDMMFPFDEPSTEKQKDPNTLPQ